MAYHPTVRTFLMSDLNHPIRRGKRTFHPFEISQMWDDTYRTATRFPVSYTHLTLPTILRV